jgi:hypothetical protein
LLTIESTLVLGEMRCSFPFAESVSSVTPGGVVKLAGVANDCPDLIAVGTAAALPMPTATVAVSTRCPSWQICCTRTIPGSGAAEPASEPIGAHAEAALLCADAVVSQASATKSVSAVIRIIVCFVSSDCKETKKRTDGMNCVPLSD